MHLAMQLSACHVAVLGAPGAALISCNAAHQVDTMIVQAIGLLDDLDKELNTYAMRVREWYGWHFPEMSRIVTDNVLYARTVSLKLSLLHVSGHSGDHHIHDLILYECTRHTIAITTLLGGSGQFQLAYFSQLSCRYMLTEIQLSSLTRQIIDRLSCCTCAGQADARP